MRTAPSVSMSSSASPLDSSRPGRWTVNNRATDGAIRVVCETGSQSGVALDDHTMTGARERGHYFRHERDTPFTARNLSRDADQHSVALLAVMYAP